MENCPCHACATYQNLRFLWQRIWMRSACFKLKFKRLVFKWKRSVSKPAAWLAWGGGGGNKLTLGKKFPAEKQKFPSPGKRFVSGSGNKGFEPEKVCVTTGNKRFRDRPGKIKFRDSSCKFPKLGFFEGR